jgi:hypothetical protein
MIGITKRETIIPPTIRNNCIKNFRVDDIVTNSQPKYAKPPPIINAMRRTENPKLNLDTMRYSDRIPTGIKSSSPRIPKCIVVKPSKNLSNLPALSTLEGLSFRPQRAQ